MSISSKVRVYELARELDLETKDILAICEQLNIAVKSHSSTITETEADSIRAVASEKGQDKKSPNPPAKSKEVSKEAAKQQILAVSKPAVRLVSPPTATSTENQTPPQPQQKTSLNKPQSPEPLSSESSSKNSNSSSSLPVTLTTTPVKPDKPAQLVQPPNRSNNVEAASSSMNDSVPNVVLNLSTPAQPDLTTTLDAQIETQPITTNPNVPVSKSQVDRTELTQELEVSEATPPISTPSTLTTAPEHQPTAVVANKPAPPKAAPLKNISKPQPAKVNAESVSSEDNPDQTNKAVLKPRVDKPKPSSNNNRPTTAPPVSEPTSSPHSAPKRPQPVRPAPVKDAVLIERGITAPGEPSRPLRAPTPPSRPTVEKPQFDKVAMIAPPVRKKDGSESGTTATPNANAAPPPVLLGRNGPESPTRANKRNKSKKEDEDQDVLELKEKAAKLHRPKRYLKVIEDEDVIDDLDSTDIPEISLSLARPTARPKQRLTKPPASAPEQKSSTAKPGRRSSGRDRRSNQESLPTKPTKLILQDSISVQELADKLMLPETDIIRTLFMKGMMVNINQTLDIPTASMVAIELGYEVEQVEADAPARKITEMIDAGDLESLQRRPPVVTIMGHVDHGKTTLLDSIRKSKVAQGEAGGITQHIGAYHVDVEHGGKKQQIVFLDTPGHEAFTAMRARGARVTDVAILVVAADDGVQPQTIEAISHARAANVPIIVAINKVDKLEAQPDRIRQELTEYGLVDEEWGGDTIMVPVSAQRGDNLDTLLEMILLVTEVEDLQANPDRSARGTVIEAHLDKARGPVATFLVQNGTLRVGDILVAGSAFGKVRAMVDDRGKRVEIASPSFAVEVLGLSDVPAAGDDFEVFTDEKLARGTASDRAMEQRHSRLQQSLSSRRVTLGTVSAKAQEGELKELNLILKADVQGSVEAILGALGQLPQQEVQVRVLLAAAGEITENDVDLAAASDAVIIGFSTTMATGARQAADAMGVDVRDYNIIYKLLEDIQDAMEGLLEPELVEEPLGQAEVRALFPIGRGVVAGCYVLSGKLVRNCKVRVRRHNELIHDGALDSLKRMKDDAKEVATGFECGVSIPKFHDWREADIIEAYRLVTKRRTLAT